jgi:hypothetical protein
MARRRDAAVERWVAERRVAVGAPAEQWRGGVETARRRCAYCHQCEDALTFAPGRVDSRMHKTTMPARQLQPIVSPGSSPQFRGPREVESSELLQRDRDTAVACLNSGRRSVLREHDLLGGLIAGDGVGLTRADDRHIAHRCARLDAAAGTGR